MIVEIQAYPRLHITLIGMNDNGYRINGGIGLALQDPIINIIAKKSKNFTFNDNRSSCFSKNQIERLTNSINNTINLKKLKWSIDVVVSGDAGSNMGFGSGTIVRLACLEALHVINEIPYTENSIVEISGRGGTSGIGIRTYFNGGFVFDIGHKSVGKIQPSSQREGIKGHSLLVNANSCPEWEIGICSAKDIKTLTHDEEIEFFKKTIPIEEKAVYETLYHVVYGIYASLQENDIATFCESLRNIQKCKWKYLERSIYGDRLLKYEKQLYRCGAKAVGMSSLGPTLFFVSDNNESVMKKMDAYFPSNSRILFNTKTMNEGRKVYV